MRKYLITGVAAVVILATGCAEMSDTQRRTATGAGVGALAGAVLSSATGGRAGTGAVVGAGVGALAVAARERAGGKRPSALGLSRGGRVDPVLLLVRRHPLSRRESPAPADGPGAA